MKKLLIIQIGILFVISCKAQILPVEDLINYVDKDQPIPENINYVKDVNGLFNIYLGTWTRVYNSRTYEFIIDEITKIHTDGFKEDVLIMKFTVKGPQGEILFENINYEDTDPKVIHGGYFQSSGTYQLYYYGPDSECGQKGMVLLSKTTNNNQLEFHFTQENDTVDPELCTGDVDYPFPIDTTIILNKQ